MFILRKQWNTVFIIVLLLVVVIFAVLNVDPVNINVGFTTFELPLVLVIIGTLLVGVLIAVMGSTTILYREKNKLKKLTADLEQEKTNAKLEKEALQTEFITERDSFERQAQQEKEDLQAIINEQKNEMAHLNRRINNIEMTRNNSRNHSIDY